MLNSRGYYNFLLALLLLCALVSLSTLGPQLPRTFSDYVDGFGEIFHVDQINEQIQDVLSGGSKAASASLSPDMQALKSLCDNTTWTEGLWVHCHSGCGDNQLSFCGGLNNARNRVQTCIRLAIDAGAGVMIPSLATRHEDNLVDTNGNLACPDIWWNLDNLEKSVQEVCPRLQMKFCEDGREGVTVVEAPGRMYLEAAFRQGTFQQSAHGALQSADIDIARITPENPVVLQFSDPYIGWNYRDSNELQTTRKALFKTITFRQSLLDKSRSISKNEKLLGGNFIGIHLRGENDWPASFGSADDQMRLYSEEVQKMYAANDESTRVVYVSSGDQTATQRFRQILQPLGYTVHDKWTLLADSPTELAELDALSFDEKGIVEYNALVEAKVFIGVIMSSMSSLVAYARTVNEEPDFFDTHVFPGSSKVGLQRTYDAMSIKGNSHTKLLVVNGVDIMDSFP